MLRSDGPHAGLGGLLREARAREHLADRIAVFDCSCAVRLGSEMRGSPARSAARGRLRRGRAAPHAGILPLAARKTPGTWRGSGGSTPEAFHVYLCRSGWAASPRTCTARAPSDLQRHAARRFRHAGSSASESAAAVDLGVPPIPQLVTRKAISCFASPALPLAFSSTRYSPGARLDSGTSQLTRGPTLGGIGTGRSCIASPPRFRSTRRHGRKIGSGAIRGGIESPAARCGGTRARSSGPRSESFASACASGPVRARKTAGVLSRHFRAP